MKLRPYQQESSDAIDAAFVAGVRAACIEIPTGGGKTHVIASTIQRWFRQWPDQVRVAVVVHTKELVRQNAEKMLATWPDAPVGVCCASLGRKEFDRPITYGSIQTMHRQTERFAASGGPFDVVMIDEAHHIPTDESAGIYTRFVDGCLVQNPNLRIVGLTATPYRLKSGTIYGEGKLFPEVTHKVGVRELIDQGHLARLRSKSAARSADTTGIHVRGGEFVADELEALVDGDGVVDAATDEMIQLAAGRRAWIVFCAGIRHAEHVAQVLIDKGISAAAVHSKLAPDTRDQILEDAAAGRITALCNVNVLSEGYDNPQIDCVVMLRPTLSPGLYYQQVGRGFRTHPLKGDCLVLDFAGNVMRHGPIDEIRAPGVSQGDGEAPVKKCPECHELVHGAVKECPECGYEFPTENKASHERTASNLGILSGEEPEEWMNVERMTFTRHRKQGKPDSVRVDYWVGLMPVSEWLCPEHNEYAYRKTVQWFRNRTGITVGVEAPVTVDRILDTLQYMVPDPTRVRVRRTPNFPVILEVA